MNIPIVVDTNVLISGYLWHGKPRQVIEKIRETIYEFLYCRESLTELVRILTEKFDLTADEIFKIIADIQQNGRHVDITSDESPVLNDPADNLFINLAIDGGAKIIISGDSHLLKLRSFKTITIINVAEFLRMG